MMEKSEEVKLNPLLIEHVAKKIFSYFRWSYSNQDLQSCRSTCKTWYHLITNTMKRNGFARKIVFSSGSSLNDFGNVMRNALNLPFDSFEFEVDFFTGSNAELFADFLRSFSPEIRCLCFSFGKLYTMDVTSVDFGELDFPRLSTLSLQCVHTITKVGTFSLSSTWETPCPRKQAEGIFHLLRFIVSSGRNLEQLDIRIPAQYFQGDQASVVNDKVVDLLATELPSESVTDLQLLSQLSDTHLHKFERLKLKKLHLDTYGTLLKQESVISLLTAQQDSLVDLKIIDFDNNFIVDSLTWPRLINVKRFEVKVETLESIVSCLNSFPYLETLVLVNYGNTAISSHSSKSFRHSKVTALELTFPLFGNLRAVEFLRNSFPNLVSFHIHVKWAEDARTLEAIFLHMTNLTELHLSFDYVLDTSFVKVDSVLTGIPISLCERIQREKMYSVQSQSEILATISRRPCLENLQELRKITIDAEGNEIALTDVTVHYALLRLPFLTELAINSHNISSECFQLLKTRLRVHGCLTRDHGMGDGGGAQPNCNEWAVVPYI